MKSIPISVTLILACLLNCFDLSAQRAYNFFQIAREQSESEYQKYVGRTLVFHEPINAREAQFKLGRIQFGTHYTINSISLNGEKVQLVVVEKDNPKAKDIRIKCENTISSYYFHTAGIMDLPAYLLDDYESAKEKYIGREFIVDGNQCRIVDLTWENHVDIKYPNDEDLTKTYSSFAYEIISNGELRTIYMADALDGAFHTELSSVEKPADESIRYGESTIVVDEGLTKFSYIDNIIDITLFGDEERIHFMLKNISDSSIRIVWNEAVFVDINGNTSKIMHSGTKFSEREKDQTSTIIIRNSKLNDTVVPTNNVYYYSSEYVHGEWLIRSMYPPKGEPDGQVSLMLPIQIKETINEYIFVFDIKWHWNYPELQ